MRVSTPTVIKAHFGVKQSSFLTMHEINLSLHLSCIVNTVKSVNTGTVRTKISTSVVSNLNI